MTVCPECNCKGAYIGLYEVKCPNSDCRYYDEEQRIIRAYEASEELASSSSDPDKTPPYPYGIGLLDLPFTD
jgi:hypothetical protein